MKLLLAKARESMRQYEASVIWTAWEKLLDECRK